MDRIVQLDYQWSKRIQWYSPFYELKVVQNIQIESNLIWLFQRCYLDVIVFRLFSYCPFYFFDFIMHVILDFLGFNHTIHSNVVESLFFLQNRSSQLQIVRVLESNRLLIALSPFAMTYRILHFLQVIVLK